MKTVTHYCCAFCGQPFTGRSDCLTHELSHLNITSEVYEKWRVLDETAKKAAMTVSVKSCDETRLEEELAIRALIDFEETYQLDAEQIRKVG